MPQAFYTSCDRAGSQLILGCSTVTFNNQDERVIEIDAQELAATYGLSVDVARMAIGRLGLLTTLVALVDVREQDSSYELFERAFPEVDAIIPEMQEEIRYLKAQGLGVPDAVDIALRYGKKIYRDGFDLAFAVDLLQTERIVEGMVENDVRARTPYLRADEACLERTLCGDECSDGKIPVCPHYLPSEKIRRKKGLLLLDQGQAVYCEGQCLVHARPLTCLGESKPLANLLGTSTIREFETIGNDPEASYSLTKLDKQL